MSDELEPDVAYKIREFFEVMDMDKKTALLKQMEINKIGDRKEVGGIVYELDEVGWKRLPIGTIL